MKTTVLCPQCKWEEEFERSPAAMVGIKVHKKTFPGHRPFVCNVEVG